MTDENTNAGSEGPGVQPPEPQKTEISSRAAIERAMARAEVDSPGRDPAYGNDPEQRASVEAEEKAEAEAKKRSEAAKKGHETRQAKKAEAEAPEESDEPARKKDADQAREKEKRADRVDESEDSETEQEGEEGEAPEPKKAAPKDEWAEPPKRLSKEATERWAEADPEIRKEVHRRFSEMERGLQQYREDYGDLHEYKNLAKQHNLTLKQALDRYTGFERQIMADPVKGLRSACTDMGLDFDKIVRHVAGMPQDQAASAQSEQMIALQRQVSQLTQMLSQEREQKARQVLEQSVSVVDQFASEHPDFDDYAEEMTILLKADSTLRIEEAYRMARARAGITDTEAAVQPRQAQKTQAVRPREDASGYSVSGSPSSGNDPTRRKKIPASAREALERRFG